MNLESKIEGLEKEELNGLVKIAREKEVDLNFPMRELILRTEEKYNRIKDEPKPVRKDKMEEWGYGDLGIEREGEYLRINPAGTLDWEAAHPKLEAVAEDFDLVLEEGRRLEGFALKEKPIKKPKSGKKVMGMEDILNEGNKKLAGRLESKEERIAWCASYFFKFKKTKPELGKELIERVYKKPHCERFFLSLDEEILKSLEKKDLINYEPVGVNWRGFALRQGAIAAALIPLSISSPLDPALVSALGGGLSSCVNLIYTLTLGWNKKRKYDLKPEVESYLEENQLPLKL